MTSTGAEGIAAHRSGKRQDIRTLVLDNMIWLILAGMFVFAYFLNPVFLTPKNILNLLVHFSVLGILVIAESFVMMSGGSDLSIESTVGFTAMISAWMMLDQAHTSGWNLNPWICIAVMFILGTIIGLINGLSVIKLNLSPFITTLAMLIILRGLTLVTSGGMMLYNLPDSYTWIGQGSVGGIPVPAIVLVVSFAIAQFVASKRVFGRELIAIGGNLEAARASGIDVNKRILQSYLLSSLLAVFAGWILSARLGSVVTSLGQGMVFDTMAASVIGGVSMQGGRGTMVGAFGGVLLLGIISNSLTLAKVSPFWIDAIRGLLIFVAVVLDAVKIRLRK